MIERHQRSLLTEMELAKSLMKLTPEGRKKEVRRRMYVELKAMEMECRQRVALEAMEKSERDREEREKAAESLRRQRENDQEERVRQEAERREEEERRANEQKALENTKQQQLKEERLRWKKVMLVEEEPVERPVCLSALKTERQRRREEAGPDRLTSGLKAEQQGKKKTLYNNWVGEQKPDSEPVKGKLHPNSSTYLLFAAKPGPKSEEKTKPPKSDEAPPWLQERLKVGYWLDKYRVHRERKDKKRRLKAEEQYARWTAFKASRTSSVSQQSDYYTEGFAISRNSILKSNF